MQPDRWSLIARVGPLILAVILAMAAFERLSCLLSTSLPINNSFGESTVIQVQAFDPHARVRVEVGSDGAPGVAGWDDDANGIVDDASELGASRSDDVCVAILSSDDLSESSDPKQASLVLQRGAFVDASNEDLRQFPDRPTREIVVAESEDGEQWTFARNRIQN